MTELKANGTTCEADLDAIVFATGFDAMTGAMKKIDIRTDAGHDIRAKWEDGPRTYLGTMMAGFSNLFMVTGPQSPGVKSQMILAIEQHVNSRMFIPYVSGMPNDYRRCNEIAANGYEGFIMSQHGATAAPLHAVGDD